MFRTFEGVPYSAILPQGLTFQASSPLSASHVYHSSVSILTDMTHAERVDRAPKGNKEVVRPAVAQEGSVLLYAHATLKTAKLDLTSS